MLSAIIYITIGAFIGWNLPQPQLAKNVQEWIIGTIKGFKEKK